jgi:hypothetical protein
MKYVRELIITILLIAGAYLVYRTMQDKERLEKYEQQDRIYQARLDSIEVLKNVATLDALNTRTENNVLKA